MKPLILIAALVLCLCVTAIFGVPTLDAKIEAYLIKTRPKRCLGGELLKHAKEQIYESIDQIFSIIRECKERGLPASECEMTAIEKVDKNRGDDGCYRRRDGVEKSRHNDSQNYQTSEGHYGNQRQADDRQYNEHPSQSRYIYNIYDEKHETSYPVRPDDSYAKNTESQGKPWGLQPSPYPTSSQRPEIATDHSEAFQRNQPVSADNAQARREPPIASDSSDAFVRRESNSDYQVSSHDPISPWISQRQISPNGQKPQIASDPSEAFMRRDSALKEQNSVERPHIAVDPAEDFIRRDQNNAQVMTKPWSPHQTTNTNQQSNYDPVDAFSWRYSQNKDPNRLSGHVRHLIPSNQFEGPEIAADPSNAFERRQSAPVKPNDSGKPQIAVDSSDAFNPRISASRVHSVQNLVKPWVPQNYANEKEPEIARDPAEAFMPRTYSSEVRNPPLSNSAKEPQIASDPAEAFMGRNTYSLNPQDLIKPWISQPSSGNKAQSHAERPQLAVDPADAFVRSNNQGLKQPTAGQEIQPQTAGESSRLEIDPANALVRLGKQIFAPILGQNQQAKVPGHQEQFKGERPQLAIDPADAFMGPNGQRVAPLQGHHQPMTAHGAQPRYDRERPQLAIDPADAFMGPNGQQVASIQGYREQATTVPWVHPRFDYGGSQQTGRPFEKVMNSNQRIVPIQGHQQPSTDTLVQPRYYGERPQIAIDPADAFMGPNNQMAGYQQFAPAPGSQPGFEQIRFNDYQPMSSSVEGSGYPERPENFIRQPSVDSKFEGPSSYQSMPYAPLIHQQSPIHGNAPQRFDTISTYESPLVYYRQFANGPLAMSPNYQTPVTLPAFDPRLHNHAADRSLEADPSMTRRGVPITSMPGQVAIGSDRYQPSYAAPNAHVNAPEIGHQAGSSGSPSNREEHSSDKPKVDPEFDISRSADGVFNIITGGKVIKVDPAKVFKARTGGSAETSADVGGKSENEPDSEELLSKESTQGENSSVDLATLSSDPPSETSAPKTTDVTEEAKADSESSEGGFKLHAFGKSISINPSKMFKARTGGDLVLSREGVHVDHGSTETQTSPEMEEEEEESADSDPTESEQQADKEVQFNSEEEK